MKIRFLLFSVLGVAAIALSAHQQVQPAFAQATNPANCAFTTSYHVITSGPDIPYVNAYSPSSITLAAGMKLTGDGFWQDTNGNTLQVIVGRTSDSQSCTAQANNADPYNATPWSPIGPLQYPGSGSISYYHSYNYCSGGTSCAYGGTDIWSVGYTVVPHRVATPPPSSSGGTTTTTPGATSSSSGAATGSATGTQPSNSSTSATGTAGTGRGSSDSCTGSGFGDYNLDPWYITVTQPFGKVDLSWKPISGAAKYNVILVGRPNVMGITTTSTSIDLGILSTQLGYQVDFIYHVQATDSAGTVLSSSDNQPFWASCTRTSNTGTSNSGSTASPAPAAATPGAFTLSAEATCTSSTAAHVKLSWTPAANATQYAMLLSRTQPLAYNGQLGAAATANGQSYEYDIDSSYFSQTDTFKITAYNGDGGPSTMGTTGTYLGDASGSLIAGVVTGSPSSLLTYPDCAHRPLAGPFTGQVALSCVNTTPTATLTWTESSGAVLGYKLFEDGSLIASGDSTSALATTRTFPVPIDPSLTSANPQLQFQISAYNSNNEPTTINVANDPQTSPIPDCTPPAPTISILSTFTSQCSDGTPQNKFEWTATGGLTDFSIIRDNNETVPYATSVTSPYTDTDVANSSTHSYKVKSGDTESAEQSIAATNCPPKPGNFVLTATADCDIATNTPVNRLSWTGSSNAENYLVLRDNNKPLGSASTATAVDDRDIKTGETHTYIVIASNGGTDSTSSNEQSGIVTKDCTPPAAPAAAATAPTAAVDHPPVAQADSATTSQDTAVGVDELANDSDPDNNLDPASVSITTQPTNGTATVQGDHTINYTPKPGFSGTDTLLYQVCDTTKLCVGASITITVTPKATQPTTQPTTQPVATQKVTPGPLTLTVTPLCVGPTAQNVLTWTAADKADHYVVRRDTATTINPSTTATSLTDTTAAAGTSYPYTVDAVSSDGTTTSSNTVSYQQTANCTPVAVNDTALTNYGKAVEIDVVANDTDQSGKITPNCVKIGTQPGHGTTTVDAVTGKVTYTPNATYYGSDSFTYTVCDDKGVVSNAATVTVTVQPPVAPNTPPQANDDTAQTTQNSFVSINVLANDVAPGSKIDLTCEKVITQPKNGTTAIDTASGFIAYTPAKDFNGTDMFTYEICNTEGLKDSATVTVTVQPPAPVKKDTNQPPQANDDAASTAHNKAVTVDVLINDSDPDGNLDPTCVKISTQPGHGTVSVDATNGRTTYAPNSDYFGTDTFQYTVCDKAGAVSNAATVTIAVGQAPPAILASTGIPILGYFVDLWNRLLTFLHLR